jgi:catechol 2,3-dioxygenase-like lactoylglutathione lyase family enzyme
VLGDIRATAALPVSDLDEAAEFYEKVLGLEEMGERDAGNAILFRTGDSHIMIYESDFAGTNEATTLLWEVDDPEAIVDQLKERGVEFEHYPELPGTTMEGDIHHMGPTVAAWFKDPDGNILCIGNAL